MNLTTRTTAELLDLQVQGQATARDIAAGFLAVVRDRDPKVRAFVHVNEEAVMARAEAVDRKRQAGAPLGPLAGVPVAIKDVLCTRGEPTTCGSRILEHFTPPYDAHVVERLRAADAVVIGKTNMDEFAMGSSTENSAFFPTRNPWDLDRTPGGSSGGSAAAVAAGMVPVSLGTDTGGSVRQPASLCGVVGLKPTYGRVSRYGLVAFASSLDQVGPFGHTVDDVARILQAIAGHDDRDSTSVNEAVPDFVTAARDTKKPLTIGLPREYFEAGLDAEVERAVREAVGQFQALGATVRDVSLPHSRYAVATYYLVATAEASSNLARYDGMHYGHRAKAESGKKLDLIGTYARSREEGFGAEVKRRIMLGTYALSSGYRDAYYIKALQVRRLIQGDFHRAFAECDVVLGPTSPTPAFCIGEKSADPLAMYLSDIYTISANLAGIPAISIPCGLTQAGLPIGLQLQARPFDEATLLRAASQFQSATDWHRRRPSGTP